MKKNILLLSLLLNFFLELPAQLPLNIPVQQSNMPEWAKLMYENPINYIALDKAYKNYYATHVFEKNNYTRYYKRLIMLHHASMDSAGNLILQKDPSILKSTAQIQTSSNQWKPYPMETFFLEKNNVACPWQVNVYRVDVSRSNPNILVAASETGGLFRTEDKGKNWYQIGRREVLNTEAIAIHPRSTDTIYVGINGAIKRSNDGGLTWSVLYSLAGAGFYEIQVHPGNPNIILAGSDRGLFRSSDNGKNWSQILTESVCDIKFHPTKTSVVYCLKYNASIKQYQLWKSTNAGSSFTARTSGWLSLKDNGARMATTAANSSRIYVIVLTSDFGPHLYRSDDEGEHWSVVAKGSYTGFDSPEFPMDNWQGYYDLAIVANQNNADEVITGTGSTFKSTDGGTSFKIIGGYGGEFSLHPDLQSAVSINSDTWIATDGGLSYSTDFFNNTANAIARNKGFYGSDFWGFDVGWIEKTMVGGRYHNGNTLWHENYQDKFIRMGGAESATGYINPIRSRQIFFSDLGAYEMPKDISLNWKWNSIPSSIWPNESYYPMEYSRMVWSPICYQTVFLGNGNKLRKSENNGASYEVLFETPNVNDWIECIEISRSNPDVIYISTRNNSLTEGLIYKSTDGGKSFNPTANPIGTNGAQRRVHRIAVSATNENEIYLALRSGGKSNKVFRSKDGGSTWVNLSTKTIEDASLSDICLQYGTQGGIYIAADDGKIFYRNDQMSDWQSYNEGLGINHFTRSLRPFYRDGILLSGSNMGVWEIPLFEKSKPIAQPTVDKLSTYCSRDTFYFEDYSVFQMDSTSKWLWSFPNAAYVSDVHSRSPKVVFGKKGSYDVGLRIENADGSDQKTIKDMIHIEENECSIDSFAGYCLDLSSNVDKATLNAVPELKNANGFTCMAWIKLNGKQDCFTQILANWGSDVGMGFGFAFQGYVSTTNLTFFWKNVPYQLTSPFNLSTNKWIHVAMVVYPDSVRLYQNGLSWTYKGNFKNFNLGETPWEIGTGVPGQCGNFQGQMDELKIYNRSLSAEEIRSNMHLIHPEGEQGLVAYYQFNESDNSDIYNRVGTVHASNGGGIKKVSTAPVAYGWSDSGILKMGENIFANSNTNIDISKLNQINTGWYSYQLLHEPDSLITTTGNWTSAYYILRNFTNGLDESASQLKFRYSGIELKKYLYHPEYLKLYKRDLENEHFNNWKYIGDAVSVDLNKGYIVFQNIGQLKGQYVIEILDSPILSNDDPSYGAAAFSIYPNPARTNLSIHFNHENTEGPLWIRNTHGQSVKILNIKNSSNQEINISDLKQGIYFISYGGCTKKLVVN